MPEVKGLVVPDIPVVGAAVVTDVRVWVVPDRPVVSEVWGVVAPDVIGTLVADVPLLWTVIVSVAPDVVLVTGTIVLEVIAPVVPVSTPVAN